MAREEEAALIGEPTYEQIGPGRVRCVETGHELLESDKDGYKSTKKCREALFDRALREGKYPLSFFEQSPDYRDRMVCKVTGAIVNKNEKAVWKHVLGKSFNRKLSLMEENKRNEEKKGNDEKTEVEVAKSKVKKQKNATREDDEDEDLDFWVPPQVDIEMEPQNDESHEESPAIEKKAKKKNKKKKDKQEAQEPNGLLENAEDDENRDVAEHKRNEKNKKKHAVEESSENPEEDKKKHKKKRKEQKTEHLPELDSMDVATETKKQKKKKQKEPGETMGEVDDTRKRMKRMALVVGPSSFQSRKKKRKTES